MEEWLPLVKKSPLFYGINDDELYTLLKCCASEQVLYEDGEYIFRMGESVNKVLVLLRERHALSRRISGDIRNTYII